MTIGVEQLLQVGYLPFQLATVVRIRHKHPVRRHLHNLCGALDVGPAHYGVFGACERLVLYELEAATVVDERVSGDARLLVVRL